MGLRTVLPTLREIAFIEIESYCIANLVQKIENNQLHEAPVYTNLKTFPFPKFRGCVDILSGGFPCQPFSNAGQRGSTDDSRHIFPDILKGITDCQPTVVFLENVEGIISSKTGGGEPVLQYVLNSLERVGYTATAGIFSAREVGASHLRKRVFILAYSNSVRCDWRAVSDSVSQRQLAFKTLERPRESLVRSEVKGRCGDLREVSWSPEPNVGRVVDGCPDRVDRIRMLGNGVVPVTASRAFSVLSKRLWG